MGIDTGGGRRFSISFLKTVTVNHPSVFQVSASITIYHEEECTTIKHHSWLPDIQQSKQVSKALSPNLVVPPGSPLISHLPSFTTLFINWLYKLVKTRAFVPSSTWTEGPGGLQFMGSQSQTQLSDFTSLHHYCRQLLRVEKTKPQTSFGIEQRGEKTYKHQGS